MTIKSAVIESFAEYSQFGSLKEFNNHFEMWMADKKRFFSKGELIGLKRLARFAAKVPGVANAKIGTVLKAIYEEYGEMGISRSTFKRMILKASEIGIFTVYETARKNGSQSSNLYVFNRFPMNELPDGDQLSHQYKTIIPFKTNIKENNKRAEKAAEEQSYEISELEPVAEQAPEEHLFVSDRVPSDFVNFVKYFFPAAKSIEEFWRMSKVAAYRNNYEQDADLLLSVSLDSFKQLVRKLKSKVKVKNPIAYFTGILNKKFQERYFEELFDLKVG
ncbi:MULTISPECIES: hypothetical protein [unclassified Mesobacillus]|uniref:hypothetical protein n=1 Tax=unclassified Mesobacillus TaxID=2675270 RepID=UPI00203F1127|nr:MULTISPECIES: hypothetical protein [unclassified Mesobacillus]MCM3124422.1 hypothetical protein [Mesobacillus sp. MER 33]MCM3234868.1 hypothetical protein [Mesobacillus sp. MER 48]